MLVKFEPQNYRELQQVASTACKSGLMPQGMTPEKFIIIAMKGAELGLPIMQSIYSINVINNKPAISAELMLALIYNRVHSARVTFMESTDLVCTIEAQRTSQDKPSSFTFSMVEAEQAGLLNKDSWKKYPSAMLRARCISAMARAIFPDALMGASYTPEELGEEPTKEDVPDIEDQKKNPGKTDAQKYAELPSEITDLFETLGLTPGTRMAGCIKYNWDNSAILAQLNTLLEAKKNQEKPVDKKLKQTGTPEEMFPEE